MSNSSRERLGAIPGMPGQTIGSSNGLNLELKKDIPKYTAEGWEAMVLEAMALRGGTHSSGPSRPKDGRDYSMGGGGTID